MADNHEDVKVEAEATAEAAADGDNVTAEASAEAEAKVEVETASEVAGKEAEELKAKLADAEERLLRLRADFENFRRRTRQEKEELSKVVAQDILKGMLPCIDNFERALGQAKELESFKNGMDMIYKQFMEALKANGLEVIETKDVKFDPNFHQAVMRVENPELEDDTITMEMQKGYMVKGKVIRPSMVQVVAN